LSSCISRFSSKKKITASSVIAKFLIRVRVEAVKRRRGRRLMFRQLALDSRIWDVQRFGARFEQRVERDWGALAEVVALPQVHWMFPDGDRNSPLEHRFGETTDELATTTSRTARPCLA